jgi:hypothetical protein
MEMITRWLWIPDVTRLMILDGCRIAGEGDQEVRAAAAC